MSIWIGSVCPSSCFFCNLFKGSWISSFWCSWNIWCCRNSTSFWCCLSKTLVWPISNFILSLSWYCTDFSSGLNWTIGSMISWRPWYWNWILRSCLSKASVCPVWHLSSSLAYNVTLLTTINMSISWNSCCPWNWFRILWCCLSKASIWPISNFILSLSWYCTNFSSSLNWTIGSMISWLPWYWNWILWCCTKSDGFNTIDQSNDSNCHFSWLIFHFIYNKF